ncbi:MAG: hypothetical protein V1676_05600 [Candidatus Diapherotrites archaeon]
MRRGQASIEILMAVGLIIIIFIFVSWFVSTRAADTEFVHTQYENQRVCERLASIISSVYAAKSGTEIKTTIESNAQIVNNSIHIGQYACDFVGKANPATLAAGPISARNQGGIVILQNP